MKIAIPFIKQSFENEGYALLSEEYVNAHRYLEYICPNGHKHRIKWGNWQQGQRCGKCFGRTEKHDYGQVKQYFEDEGYTLLTKEYKNTRGYLEYICPNGHQHKMTFYAWQKGIRCKKCSDNKKRTEYDQIKQSFEKEGYKLLSKEYINNKQHLEYICPNGHKHKITWNNWQHKRRCGKCSVTLKHSYNFIKKSFEKEGYTLLSKEYINAHQYLEYICPNGHKHKIKWFAWHRGHRCGRCKGNIEVTYDQIKQSFEKERYTLLTKNYKNNIQKLKYICPNGHEHKISWNSWLHGNRCSRCSFIDGSSKPEKEILEYVKNNYNGTIIENDRTLIKNPKTNQYLELDVWLPELRKAIEYNGEYWHKDKYSKWKDNYKQDWCKENNINLLTIDEENWIKNKDWNKINNFIKM